MALCSGMERGYILQQGTGSPGMRLMAQLMAENVTEGCIAGRYIHGLLFYRTLNVELMERTQDLGGDC